jgi:hypothetical protein
MRGVVVVSMVLSLLLPSAGSAESLAVGERNRAVVQRTVDAARLFDAVAIARVVDAQLRTALAAPPQATTPAPPKRDSLRNGIMIGAVVGALAGAVSGATDDCGGGPDIGGGCDYLTGPAIVAGVVIGGVLGAGIGGFVDWLIR